MGHARAYLTMDILRRILEDYFGYQVFMQASNGGPATHASYPCQLPMPLGPVVSMLPGYQHVTRVT